MTNALTVSNLPAHLAVLAQNTSLQALNQDAVKGISSGSWPRISIKGNRFRLQDPQGQEFVVPDNYLDVVIVAVNSHGLSKIYYAGAYDPAGDGTAPDCYSDNGVAPSHRAQKPQCGTCAACPHNVWGSKITPGGSQVKACADIKKVAVLLANNTSGPAFELRIPAASLSNWGAYVRGLDAAGIPAASVVTRLQFDTSADYPKLLFGTPTLQEGQSPYITQEMLADVLDLLATGKNEVDQCTGENDKPRSTIEPLPTAAQAIQSATTDAYGPVRAPLANVPPPPPAAPRTPHVSGPPLHPSQVGPTPPPNPAFPHAGAPAQQEAPAKRTRKRKEEPAQPSTAEPQPPAFVRNMVPPVPPAHNPRDAAAPVNVNVTDAALDDMLAQAMRT